MRINKYLSVCGVCSRREADKRISAGRVTIDGKVCNLGDDVTDTSIVCVDGVMVSDDEDEVVLAYHKPVGVVCTTDEKEPDNIIKAIGYPKRVYPVGRLDKDSSGLILLTNNGMLMDNILKSRNNHEKEYVVTLNKPMKPSEIEAMEQGVPILDTMTKPCRITDIQNNSFHIILTQGLNRQIRRMCDYMGYRVKKLIRIRVMSINLGSLCEGSYRVLDNDEVKALKDACGL